MNKSLTTFLRGLGGVIVLAATAVGLWFGGIWYAHQQMDMGAGGASSDDMSGMDMSSPNRMPSSSEQDDIPSNVAGYAALKVSADLQQQIGVTTGIVELAPLKMSVKTVGIIRPDETRLSEVYLRTEGWVQEVFVDFMGKTVEQGAPLLSGVTRVPLFELAVGEGWVDHRWC